MTTAVTASDRRRLLEIGLIALTGLGKFVFMDWLNWRLPYILTACLFWMGYILYRRRQSPNILSQWGLSTNRFQKTFLELLPLALLSTLAFVFLGEYLETSVLNRNVLPLLLVYPLWGIIQQFLIIGLIAQNLQQLEAVDLSKGWIVLIAALVFAVVHFPYLLLVGGTFVLALLYTWLFLKGRNLVVMGIYHGWLGAFFFYTLLGRDPWNEVFAQWMG
ncbi:MAG: CPBP family glutamic-type intramembrane protease [Bacteroidota bacterium]